MIEKITYIESTHTYPYNNLAIEEHLLLNCGKNECILYLWQNRHTVVIGRNQNAWKECLVDKLEEDEGHLVRRLSGGGAVYHDLGNLNFTFLVTKENYNLDKQLQVIIKAIEKFGVKAEKSGRNDILIEGRKFSGNAYYETGNQCYHHGTIMIDVNISELSKYLTVSKQKLQSKGVESVKSRVANLKDFNENITVSSLKRALLEAFEEVYGLKAEIIAEKDLDAEDIKKRKEHFESWKFKFGKKIDFKHEVSNRFEWGEVLFQIKVNSGLIEEIGVFSDSLKTEFIIEIPALLRGSAYNREEICRRISNIVLKDETEEKMKKDIVSWIESIDL